MTQQIKAKIQKIMQMDEKSAFCIARATPIDSDFDKSYLSMYGNFSVLGTGYLMEDMEYEFSGEWKKNYQGYTLIFDSYSKIIPSDVDGLTSYIQTIKGIGPTIAKKITNEFGLSTLDVMENEPSKLLKINGISKNKLEVIKENFTRNKGFEELSKFLSHFGISTKRTAKIYEKYGDGAEKKINENPYILSEDIEGISFISSDIIAKKMGFALDHFYRLSAGINYILKESGYIQGHLFLYEQELSKAFKKLFPSIGDVRFEEVLSTLEKQKSIIRIDGGDKIYLPKLFKMEDYVARKTVKLCGTSTLIKDLDILIKQCEEINKIKYDELQIEAIKIINSGSSVNIITGGPGTGKSTIIKAILGVLEKDNPKISIKLAAPTGRAAKRMEEATGHPATTIHRLLETDYTGNSFLRNSNNPLVCDALIIDESSMLDMELFCNLINAIGPNTRLFLIGDIDQLPPVGIGYVFRDLIESDIVPVVKLNKIFRQGEGSIIKENSKKIKLGETTLRNQKGSFEFHLCQKKEGQKDIKMLQHQIIELFKSSYEEEKSKNEKKAIYQVQILSPMRKGELGVNKLNSLIQYIHNPKTENTKEIVFWDKDKTNSVTYRINDKVMQIKNDVERDVYNGDLGIIESIVGKGEGTIIYVRFENNELVEYEKKEIRENLVLAYVTTVHKSQGSEYSTVIFVLSYVHTVMRQRNLFYTAVTRAKETVHVVGDKESVGYSIRNIVSTIRNSKLKERLEQYKKRAA